MGGIELDLQVIVDVPVQRGADHLATVLLQVDGGLAVLGQHVQAVGEYAGVIDLAAEVAVQVVVLAAGIAEGDAVVALVGRSLEHVVHQAAGRGRAVQETGEAGDDFQLLGVFDEVAGIGTVGEAQAVVGDVHVARAAEAADGHRAGVAGGARAVQLGSRVALEHVVEAGGLGVLQEFLGDHAHGVGRVLQLHAAEGTDVLHVLDPIAGLRAAFDGGEAGVDVRVGQGDGVFFHGHQAVGAGRALFQLQTRSAQRLLQGADGVVLAADRCRGATAGQGRVEGQGNAGLAGDLVQGGGQRRGGQVVAAQAGLFGGDQVGAGQGGGDGDGHGQQAWTQEAFD